MHSVRTWRSLPSASQRKASRSLVFKYLRALSTLCRCMPAADATAAGSLPLRPALAALVRGIGEDVRSAMGAARRLTGLPTALSPILWMLQHFDLCRFQPELLAYMGVGEETQHPAIRSQRAQRNVAGLGELRRRPEPAGLQQDQAAGDHADHSRWQLGLSCMRAGAPAAQVDTAGEEWSLAEAHEELVAQQDACRQGKAGLSAGSAMAEIYHATATCGPFGQELAGCVTPFAPGRRLEPAFPSISAQICYTINHSVAAQSYSLTWAKCSEQPCRTV